MTDMKRTRFTEEQIIGFLKQAEAGMPIKELCRQGGFSEATFYKWRARYGGMQASEAKRLRDLEVENNRLKKLLADHKTWPKPGSSKTHRPERERLSASPSRMPR
jgi:putative transposase